MQKNHWQKKKKKNTTQTDLWGKTTEINTKTGFTVRYTIG